LQFRRNHNPWQINRLTKGRQAVTIERGVVANIYSMINNFSRTIKKGC
jgi:hypothetical protein